MPAGRPSDYSPELVEEICQQIVEGRSVYQICEADSMPNYRTIWRWLERHPEFASKYARARELQAEYMDHLILKTAEACKTKDDFYAAKVKIGAYQWRAMKLAPKKYGTQHIEQTITNKTVKRDPKTVEAARTADKAEFDKKFGLNGAKPNGNGVAH